MYNNKNKYDTRGDEAVNDESWYSYSMYELKWSSGTYVLVCVCEWSYLFLLHFIWRVSLSGYVLTVTANSAYKPDKL